MGSFSQPLGSLGVTITGDPRDAMSALDQVVAAAEKAEAEMSRIDLAAGMADRVAKDVDAMKEKFSGMAEVGSQLTGLGTALSVGITAPLGALAAVSVSAAKDMDSLTRGLTAVTGSADETAKQMERLKEVAKLPGLGLEEAVQGSIRLQSVGVSATEAERQMKAFGNALATVGKGRADLDAVITQLVQMSSKTQVVAEDLKPIMERVPQVAKILKEAYGTIDTEQLQKAGHTTQEVIGTIIGGLEKLPPVSGGIGNAFENLADSAKRSLAAIGNAQVPTIERIIPLLETMLGWVAKAFEAFGKLPEPVQNAAVAVGLLVAAIGPLILAAGSLLSGIASLAPALTGLKGALGIATTATAASTGAMVASAATMGVWVVAIAAAVAALATLGKAVYDLAQAHNDLDRANETNAAALKKLEDHLRSQGGAVDELKEKLKAGDITQLQYEQGLRAIGIELGKAKTAADGAGVAFANLADEMKNSGVTKFVGPVTEYATALKSLGVAADRDVAPKIAVLQEKMAVLNDGLKKNLISPTEYAKATKKLGEELKTLTDGTGKVAGGLGNLTGILKENTTEADKAAKKAGDLARAYADAWDAAHKRYDQMAKDYEKNVQWFEQAYSRLEKLDDELAKSQHDLAMDYARAHESMRKETLQTVEITVKMSERIPAEVQKVIDANKKLEESYKRLGITSAAELDKILKQTEEDMARIFNNPKSTEWERDNAMLRVLKAQKEAAIANGREVPEILQRQIDELEEKYSRHHETTRSMWQDWADDIKGILKNFLGNAFDRIFGGSEHNKQLDEETAAVKEELGERTTEYEAFVAETNRQLGELHDQYMRDLAEEDDALATNLADAAREYEEFAADVAKNIENIQNETKGNILGEQKDAAADIREKVKGFEDFAADVEDNIERITEKWKDSYADQKADLERSLDDRREDYERFVEDAETKLSRLAGSTNDSIADETQDTERSIRDRKKDYDRYAEDVAKKIRKLREKNGGQYSEEEDDLQTSLRRRKEDLDQYVADQQADLQEYIAEQRERQRQEEEDIKKSLDRRAADWQLYQSDIAAKQAEAYDKYVTGLATETGAQKQALADRKADLDAFVLQRNQQAEERIAKFKEDEAEEIAAQQTALADKKADYEKHVTDITGESDRRKAAITKSYEDETGALNAELAKQKTEYDNYVTGVTGPGGTLDKLREAHRTLWDDIKGFATGALGQIGQSMLDLISEKVMGAAVKGLLGEEGFGGLAKTLGDLFTGENGIFKGIAKGFGSLLGGLFGGGGGVDLGDMFDVGKSVGDIFGTGTKAAGGGGGKVLSGILGNASFDPVTAGLNFAGDLLNFFGGMRQEGTMNQIERNTAAASIHLKEILETGVNKWLAKLDQINGFLWDHFIGYFGQHMSTTEEIRDSLKSGGYVGQRLEDIRSHADWTKQFTDMNRQTLYEARDALNDIKAYMLTTRDNTQSMKDKFTGAQTWTVQFTGDPIARLVGDEIMRQLRMQGVNLV